MLSFTAITVFRPPPTQGALAVLTNGVLYLLIPLLLGVAYVWIVHMISNLEKDEATSEPAP